MRGVNGIINVMINSGKNNENNPEIKKPIRAFKGLIVVPEKEHNKNWEKIIERIIFFILRGAINLSSME